MIDTHIRKQAFWLWLQEAHPVRAMVIKFQAGIYGDPDPVRVLINNDPLRFCELATEYQNAHAALIAA
ncbi:hypothetical protein C4565_03770 [Candidatus Parcubacteria bacterium]|nr:MAG: hypothetical protein C4565_03770 [Candidatus Parcubacteria bacterium]